MSARSGVIKAIASFCRIDSDTAFERHRSRIPINCDELETVQSLKEASVVISWAERTGNKIRSCRV